MVNRTFNNSESLVSSSYKLRGSYSPASDFFSLLSSYYLVPNGNNKSLSRSVLFLYAIPYSKLLFSNYFLNFTLVFSCNYLDSSLKIISFSYFSLHFYLIVLSEFITLGETLGFFSEANLYISSFVNFPLFLSFFYMKL